MKNITGPDSHPQSYGLQEYGTPGVVPEKMQAWVIEKDRFGEPLQALVERTVPVPQIGDNGPRHGRGRELQHGLGRPGPADQRLQPARQGLSRAGIGCFRHRLAGRQERQELPGWDGGLNNPNFTSFDPMSSQNHAIMGYETPDGSYAQFVAAQAQQILPKPRHLTWEDAASYILTYFTAYRMLITQAEIKPGELVLVWGGAGGLGTYALQLCREVGADAIAVVSSEEKGKFCMKLGAIGYINRTEFKGYEVTDAEFNHYETAANNARRNQMMKAMGKRIWEICGQKRSPDVVFEHSGRETFATSVFLAARFGRIVICGATTGYELSFDVRHLWMHQKRILGSHYANFLDCRQANALISRRKVDVINSRTYAYNDLPQAHHDLYNNKIIGNASVLIMPGDVTGMKTREEIEERFSA